MEGGLIYIMIGPPCSGKTTLAKRMSLDPNNVRISREDLRSMIRGHFTGETQVEDLVSYIVDKTLGKALEMRRNAILDQTNCKYRRLSSLEAQLKDQGWTIRRIVLDIPYWKQRWRNFWRWVHTGNWIPRKVAQSMDKNFRLTLQSMQDANTRGGS